MRAYRICAALTLLAALGPAAFAQDAAALLATARARIVEAVRQLPNYTCVATIQRDRYEVFGPARRGCGSELLPGAGLPRAMLAWSDALKLDVTLADGKEMVSWAGAPRFEDAGAQALAGTGLTSTGDFGPFLLDIFGEHAPDAQFLGFEWLNGRRAAAYSYRVPIAASGYQLLAGTTPVALAYEGKFWLDAGTAELLRLTIVVPDPPRATATCRIETAIDYRRVPAGGRSLLLPASTALTLWDDDGARYENHAAYGACREFASESAFRPEPAQGISPAPAPSTAEKVSIPPGKRVRIELRTRIDSATAFAGEPVEGVLVRPVRGAVVHGRIVRAERHVRPSAYVVLGLAFDSLAAEPVTITRPGERTVLEPGVSIETKTRRKTQ